MPTKAFKAGWCFERGDAATGSTVWTRVGEVIDLGGGIGTTGEEIDVTNCESGGVREFIAGFQEGQELTVESNLVIDDAVQQLMTADAIAGNNWEFRVEFDDGTNQMEIKFVGAVKSWNPVPALTEQNKIQWTIKTNQPTLTYT